MKINTKSILLLLCFLCFITPIVSQSVKIDSLKIELQNHKEKDTIRVNLLNTIAFSYRRKNLNKTLYYIEESDKITNVIDFEKGKARSLYIRGVAELMQSNYDKSIKHFKNAIQIYNHIDYKKDIAVCYIGIGIVHYYQGHNEEALLHYKKAQQNDEALGIKKSIISNTYNIGVVYVAMGKYREGLANYNKTLKLYRKKGNKKSEGNVLNSMANVYRDLGDYSTSLEYYNKSLSVCEEINDSIGIARAFTGLGNIYKDQSRYDEALEYHEKSLIIQENKKNKKNIATVKSSIGRIYRDKKDHAKAIKFFEEALGISKEIKAENNIAAHLNSLGSTYLQLKNYNIANKYYEEAIKINIKINSQTGLFNSYIGLSKVDLQQNKYNEALTYALKSNEIANNSELIIQQRTVYKLLAEIYENTGDYKKAYKNHQQFKILNDSLFNKENIEKITQLEYEYKYKQALDSASMRELKLTETVTTTNENLEKTKRNYLWVVIGFLLVSILLGSIIFHQKLRNENSKTQNAVIEQKLLRSQMTPHFIFNSLSVLQGMILNKEEKKSVSYLSKFSKLLRIILENSRDKTVLLSQELSAIQNYLALQNLENDVYEYTILVEDTIDVPLFEIPPMLIQPFVENAIEHAFTDKKDDKKIDIRLKYADNKLICIIADNGSGYSPQKKTNNEHKKSLSTTITSERLKILSKDFKMKGYVTIKDRQIDNEKGTIVTLVIPHKILAV